MNIREFIDGYFEQGYRGYVELIFEGKENIYEGIPIPNSFELLNDICRYPVFAIFVNSEEKAILQFDENEYSLSIYDDFLTWNETIKKHKEYYYETYLNKE